MTKNTVINRLMNTNILTLASGLSDHDLLTRLLALAGKEREATAELVAHLAALDSRPSVYAAKGYGTLFTYCVEALRLSEDATCNRIGAARACRRFPAILEALAAGTMSLTSVRMLSPHLTDENWRAVLARAAGRSRREIEALVAELAPRPDVPASVRKLPAATNTLFPTPGTDPPVRQGDVATAPDVPSVPAPPSAAPVCRPVIQTTSPERYRVQFTIGKESHDKLRRLQDLLRREIPSGDPGAIFDRAVALLLEKVEKESWAWFRSREHGAVSAPERMSRTGGPSPHPATSRATSGGLRGGATEGSVRSSRQMGIGAPSARSWSSTT
jgi:hypothetical protein